MMPLDPQHMIDGLIGVVLLLMGAIMKALWDAVKTLQRDIQNIEVELPKSYVPKEDFQKSVDELKALLNKIADKLDGKVDKSK